MDDMMMMMRRRRRRRRRMIRRRKGGAKNHGTNSYIAPISTIAPPLFKVPSHRPWFPLLWYPQKPT
jgi:hypothetical protein